MIPEYEKIIKWLNKDFETAEYWKGIGRELFLWTNGDSDLARLLVADALRDSFSKLGNQPVQVKNWNDDFTEVVTVEIESPDLNVSKELYIDWIRAADHILLACSSSWDRLEDENQRRRELNERALNGYKARQMLIHISQYLSNHDGQSDEEALEQLQSDGIDAKRIQIGLAKKIDEAFLESKNAEKAPQLAKPIATYKSIYFKLDV